MTTPIEGLAPEPVEFSATSPKGRLAEKYLALLANLETELADPRLQVSLRHRLSLLPKKKQRQWRDRLSRLPLFLSQIASILPPEKDQS